VNGIEDEKMHKFLEYLEGPFGVLNHQIGEQGVAPDGIRVEQGDSLSIQGEFSFHLAFRETYLARYVLEDMYSLREEDRDHDENIDGIMTEFFESFPYRRGVEIHESASDDKFGIFLLDETGSTLYEFLVVRQFTTMPHQQQSFLPHDLYVLQSLVKLLLI